MEREDGIGFAWWPWWIWSGWENGVSLFERYYECSAFLSLWFFVQSGAGVYHVTVAQI